MVKPTRITRSPPRVHGGSMNIGQEFDVGLEDMIARRFSQESSRERVMEAMEGLKKKFGYLLQSGENDNTEKTAKCPYRNARNKELDPEDTLRIEKEAREGWTALYEEQRRQDTKMVSRRTAEIDTNLLGATLFSAIIAAFLLDSYKNLQQDPADLSNHIVSQLSRQMASFTVANGFTNSTAPPFASRQPFTPSTSAVRINLLWFASLVLSLVNALFNIFVRQWLHTYNDWELSSIRESVRLRQARFEGFIAWGMYPIMAFLPLLLQISIVLFLVGLAELLWTLHHLIALVVTLLVAIPVSLAVVSAVIPLIFPECPFYSPFSAVLLLLCSIFKAMIKSLLDILILIFQGLLRRDFSGPWASYTRKRRVHTGEAIYALVAGARDLHHLRQHRGGYYDIGALEWVYRYTFNEDLQEKIILPCMRVLDSQRPERRTERNKALLHILRHSFGRSPADILAHIAALSDEPVPVSLFLKNSVMPGGGTVSIQLRLLIELLDGACTCNRCDLLCRGDILALIQIVMAAKRSRAVSTQILVREMWPRFVEMGDDLGDLDSREIIHITQILQYMMLEISESPREEDIACTIKWASMLAVSDLEDTKSMAPHAFESAVTTALEVWYHATKRLDASARPSLDGMWQLMRQHLHLLEDARSEIVASSKSGRLSRKRARSYLEWGRPICNILQRDGNEAVPRDIVTAVCDLETPGGYVTPISAAEIRKMRSMHPPNEMPIATDGTAAAAPGTGEAAIQTDTVSAEVAAQADDPPQSHGSEKGKGRAMPLLNAAEANDPADAIEVQKDTTDPSDGIGTSNMAFSAYDAAHIALVTPVQRDDGSVVSIGTRSVSSSDFTYDEQSSPGCVVI